MDSVESYLRKLIVASVGAADLGCEKLGKLLDECVARGEVTVEKGRVLNEELKRTCKQAAAKDADEKPAVDLAVFEDNVESFVTSVGHDSVARQFHFGAVPVCLVDAAYCNVRS